MGRIIGMLLFAIIIGPIIGGIARLILPGKQDISFMKTWAIGTLGAFVGGIIALIFGWDATKGIDWIQWGLQILCAVIGVALVAGVGGKKKAVSRA